VAIRVLDRAVASLIAAGEVVERPASVAKELIENALDAGATRVAVEVKGGGTALLRVADNGCGIPEAEVPLAFQRHATSKIHVPEDLHEIRTLGFRGEALPSIAAVAEVTVLTRTPDETAGTYLSLACGRLLEQGHRGCPVGTIITVRNLFAEVPARAKFLRSQATEVGHISNLLTQYALAYPEVQFTLQVEGREVFRSPGSGELKDALTAVYGIDLVQSMLPVRSDAEDASEAGQSRPVKVTGFVSSPAVHRATRGQLSFFVNRRWVQNRMLVYATEEAYQGLLMSGRHPIGVLNVELSPSGVDVNIHPAKSEVKFLNERLVFAAVQRAVRATVLSKASVPTIMPRPAAAERQTVEQARMAVFRAGGWDGGALATRQPYREQDNTFDPSPRLPILRILGQISSTYVIAEGPDGMYLIDQHTAHERVIYDRILRQQMQQGLESQGLLEPLPVEVPLHQVRAIERALPELADLGFSVERFGERTYLVRAVPAVIGTGDVADTFLSIAESVSTPSSKEDRLTRLAAVLACHGAVRAGQTLSMDEMKALLRDLEATELPLTCPHGRPTMIHLSASQLEREFGRR